MFLVHDSDLVGMHNTPWLMNAAVVALSVLYGGLLILATIVFAALLYNDVASFWFLWALGTWWQRSAVFPCDTVQMLHARNCLPTFPPRCP